MSVYDYAEHQGIGAIEAKQQAAGKPLVVKIATVIMYVMVALVTFAVLGGQTMAVIFIPLIAYLAYGLSGMKASARKGAIAFACFGLAVNLGAYISSGFAMHGALVDVAFHAAIVGLLLTPSAHRADWVK